MLLDYLPYSQTKLYHVLRLPTFSRWRPSARLRLRKCCLYFLKSWEKHHGLSHYISQLYFSWRQLHIVHVLRATYRVPWAWNMQIALCNEVKGTELTFLSGHQEDNWEGNWDETAILILSPLLDLQLNTVFFSTISMFYKSHVCGMWLSGRMLQLRWSRTSPHFNLSCFYI